MIIDKSKLFSSSTDKEIRIENLGCTPAESQKQARIKTVSQLKKKPSNPYNYKLIETLENEHKELLRVYRSLMQSTEERQYKLIPLQIKEFCMCLTEHLRHEDSELYIYLDYYHLKRNKLEEQEVLKDFRSEMKEITIELESMLHQSPNLPVTDKTLKGFLLEFKAIGNILMNRIRREESVLYPLYENLSPL